MRCRGAAEPKAVCLMSEFLQESGMQEVTLDDKYASDQGRVYLTGIQALVRLALVQRRRDLAAGLNTAGFISGYRGSPLGGLDEALWKAGKHLEAHHVKFQPGRQRRPGRHRRVGHAAGAPDRRVGLRRRVRHVVRQGTGRRSLRRRVQAHELRRHREARRRAAGRRRRPRRLLVDAAAPERSPVLGLDDPGAVSRATCRSTSSWACTAGPCRASPAARSASRRWPTRSSRPPRSRPTRSACRSGCRRTS